MAITDTITAQWLKDRYLVGIDLTDDQGNEYPAGLYDQAINAAIATVEAELDIVIGKASFTERKDTLDFHPASFFLMNLFKRPVASITSLEAKLGDFPPADIPASWVHISNKIAGQIQIIPGQEKLGSIMFGGKFPFLGLSGLMGRPYTPLWWRIEYEAGYEDDEVPNDILDLIGLLASMLPLDTAGDLIAGAGIASTSVSLDGLSTSVNTTSSATNSGYGARAGNYSKRAKELLKQVKRRYRAPNMFVI